MATFDFLTSASIESIFSKFQIQRLVRLDGQGLVLLPTRELDIQVNDSLYSVGKSLGFSSAVITGGAPEAPQKQAINGQESLKTALCRAPASKERVPEVVRPTHILRSRESSVMVDISMILDWLRNEWFCYDHLLRERKRRITAMAYIKVQSVEAIIEQLGELPSAPVVLSKALKLTSDLDSNINDISKNIAADQSLAARVIRLSNSPLFGRAREIASLHEAIIVLGFDQVKSIIITASTAQMFQSGSHTKIAKVLWEHSLATAFGARLIVQKCVELDKEEAYLCGLLHDIGKLVMLKKIPEVYESIIATVKSTCRPFLEVEGRVLGFNHVQVCRELLSKWGFPTKLITQISAHHSTKLNQIEATASLARVTAIANSVAKYIGASFFEAYQPEKENIFYLGDKLIAEDDLIALRVDTEAIFHSEINSLFE